jgi:hypothetical protein
LSIVNRKNDESVYSGKGIQISSGDIRKEQTEEKNILFEFESLFRDEKKLDRFVEEITEREEIMMKLKEKLGKKGKDIVFHDEKNEIIGKDKRTYSEKKPLKTDNLNNQSSNLKRSVGETLIKQRIASQPQPKSSKTQQTIKTSSKPSNLRKKSMSNIKLYKYIKVSKKLLKSGPNMFCSF